MFKTHNCVIWPFLKFIWTFPCCITDKEQRQCLVEVIFYQLEDCQSIVLNVENVPTYVTWWSATNFPQTISARSSVQDWRSTVKINRGIRFVLAKTIFCILQYHIVFTINTVHIYQSVWYQDIQPVFSHHVKKSADSRHLPNLLFVYQNDCLSSQTSKSQ